MNERVFHMEAVKRWLQMCLEPSTPLHDSPQALKTQKLATPRLCMEKDHNHTKGKGLA